MTTTCTGLPGDDGRIRRYRLLSSLTQSRYQLHPKALQLRQGKFKLLITTEFVLMEVGDGPSRPGNRQLFARLLELLHHQADVEIIPSSASLFRKACDLHASRVDKDWSLTDCTSFVVMTERHLQEVLTSDHHFRQAGFKPLMLD